MSGEPGSVSVWILLSLIIIDLNASYQKETKFKILLPLAKITIMPTASIIDFAEIRLETFAAMGDAIALPITSPHIASQCREFNMVINVSELNKAIKKREYFTVPSEKRGCRPPAISDDKTIEPQPPPPTASIKPPPKPRTPIFLIFFFLTFRFTLRFKAFCRITAPK